jgi:hypothetical protein
MRSEKLPSFVFYIVSASMISSAVSAGTLTLPEDSGVPLYDGANAGMSLDDLKRVFPDLQSASADQATPGYDVWVDQRIIAQRFDVTARFLLKGNRLNAVVLDVPERSPAGIDPDWADLKSALTDKYGPALDCENVTGTFPGAPARRSCTWSASGVSVSLNAFSAGASFASISIQYKVNQANSSGL